MKVLRSQLFTASFVALRAGDPTMLRSSLLKSSTSSTGDTKRLPQVRFGIAQSAFRDVLGEVRSHIPGEKAFVRTLFAMPRDEWCCAFLVIGNKNTSTVGGATGNAWYDEAVPIADEIWRGILPSRPE